MKFTKSDLVKMGGTALITAAVFSACNLFSTGGQVMTLAKSERISREHMDSLKNEYKDFKPMRVKHSRIRDVAGDTIVSPLEGFKFDAGQLGEIIYRNLHLNPGDTADEVIFYFGKRGDWGRVAGSKLNAKARMHIVAVGIKNDTLLTNRDRKNATRSSIFDKADPCPPYCPKERQ